jgi:hypothetical protein
LLVVGGCCIYPCGRFASRTCYCSHFPHLELLTASPLIVFQPGYGGSCAKFCLKALAKALQALVGADNGCGTFRSSPRWGCCRGHQTHLAPPGEKLVCSFAGGRTMAVSISVAPPPPLEASFGWASSGFLRRLWFVRHSVMCVFLVYPLL